MPAAAMPATATMRASLNWGLTPVAACGPADAPSKPTPRITPPTASHSRQASSRCISHAANTAVTARLPAMIACAANSGNCRSATSWATEADEVKAEAGDERPLVQHAHDQARVHRAQPRPVRGCRAPTGRLYRHRLHDRGDAIAQGSHQRRRHADQHISDTTPPMRRQASQRRVCPRCARIGGFRRRSEWVCEVGHESAWRPARRAGAQPRGATATPCAASAARACGGVLKCTARMPSAAAAATFSGRSSMKTTSAGRAPSMASTAW